jgi:hypothetical protein
MPNNKDEKSSYLNRWSEPFLYIKGFIVNREKYKME